MSANISLEMTEAFNKTPPCRDFYMRVEVLGHKNSRGAGSRHLVDRQGRARPFSHRLVSP